MKHKVTFLAVAFMAATFGIQAQIQVDGSFSDWNNVPANQLAQATTDEDALYVELYATKWTSDSSHVFFYMEFNADSAEVKWLNIYMSTDDNPSTGMNIWCWNNSAADYMIEGSAYDFENAKLYHYPANSDQVSWDWYNTGQIGFINSCSPIVLSNGHAAIEGAISRSVFSATVFHTPLISLKVGVLTCTGEWYDTGCLPQVTLHPYEGYTITYPLLEVPLVEESSVPVTIPTSGTCGQNLSWIIRNDTLVISGSGNMTDYSPSNPAPWNLSIESVKAIEIGDSVTSLGEYAFAFGSSITSITIPENTNHVGNNAFYSCDSLFSVTINSDSVVNNGWLVYTFGHQVKECVLGNSVTCIGQDAFRSFSNLTSITIPNSVTNIKGGAFAGCSSLSSIVIPSSVASMGEGQYGSLINQPVAVFAGCNNLTSVVWNAKNCTIGSPYARPFHGNSITSFVFGDSVKTIPHGLCFEMSNLTSVIIPFGVTTIEAGAFGYCWELTSVTIPNSVTSISNAFSGTGLTSISLPNSITSLEDGAFQYCYALTNITIPNSVTSIEGSAFAVCSSLRSVVIPNSVISIGDGAFAYCTILDTITCFAVVPPAVEDFTFEEVPTSAKLFVPAGSVAAYQADSIWGRFFIQPIEATDLLNVENDNSLNGSVRDLLANPAIKVYNLQGYDVSANRNDLPAGVYILRLNNQAAKVTIR